MTSQNVAIGVTVMCLIGIAVFVAWKGKQFIESFALFMYGSQKAEREARAGESQGGSRRSRSNSTDVEIGGRACKLTLFFFTLKKNFVFLIGTLYTDEMKLASCDWHWHWNPPESWHSMHPTHPTLEA
ncbi:hypothetical protein F4778DRAFT_537267 [Xylariomycetidae sp. FL2044]|nr:hypothetical protein F4778DRAFT_537267 [Xylariomycetidae sp. FL2044]